ncbi:peroxide stress protein YaaA [Derxia lacustris]|uniref:peroxide stress protein YaaA n=1 Tax=Derxia lacustris TaxID=764842 RepID=UPI000A178059|nr:peroxide stress protein YaaA [Derxia lacustris]
MLLLLSPAKSLDTAPLAAPRPATLPDFIPESATLAQHMRRLGPQDLAQIMGISDELAVLNVTRFQSWSPEFTDTNSKQAVLAFNGDVYEGLNAATLDAAGLAWAQDHLRILSGLYGVLRPLDRMQPYRLEMGTRLKGTKVEADIGTNLYGYWGDKVTLKLNEALAAQKAAQPVVVNCASEEYFKVVKPKLLAARLVTPVFEDWKGGKFKIISFYAKRARGLMARYAVDHRVSDVEQLKRFDSEGYAFDAAASDDAIWRFRRRVE